MTEFMSRQLQQKRLTISLLASLLSRLSVAMDTPWQLHASRSALFLGWCETYRYPDRGRSARIHHCEGIIEDITDIVLNVKGSFSARFRATTRRQLPRAR